MKILVFDYCLKVTGHRLHYATLVAEAFSEMHDVVLGLPNIIEHEPQVAALFSRSFCVDFFAVRGKTEPVKGFFDSLFKAFKARTCLIRLVKHHQPDLVAIPTADGLALVTSLLNFFPSTALRRPIIDICLMRGPQCYSKQVLKQAISNVKWWLVRQGPWQRILMMDPREWSRVDNAIAQRVFLCPDPVPTQNHRDRQIARELLNLPMDGRMVVSVGPQNMRKGSDLLIKGFAAANLNENDRLVMIGRIDPVITPLIESLKQRAGFDQRLIVRDEFVSEDEFQMAIVASNVVAVPYRSVDRPSGIVCRAMAWERPLIMTNRGWLRWVLENFGAGLGADSTDPAKFGATIRHALDQSSQFQTSGNAREFIEFNTEEHFLRVWRCGVDFSYGIDVQAVDFLTHASRK